MRRPLVDDFVCPRCGARRTVDAAATPLCPSCLLATALGDDDDEQNDPAVDAPPFDVVTILARDGDAVTYLARGLASSDHVALKIIETPDADAIAARIRTWRTRLIAARHPGVSRLADAGRTGRNGVYLATDYVPGPSLDYVLRHAALRHPERVEIARQAGDALAALHAQGLAHMRVDASRIKVTIGAGVHVTILGLAASLVVCGLPLQPRLDVVALVDLCERLGVELPPQPYDTLAMVRAALQDVVA